MYTRLEAECVINVYRCNCCFLQNYLVLSFEITFEIGKKPRIHLVSRVIVGMW